MQMHVIDSEAGAVGPYTDKVLLQKTLAIIGQIDPGAEVISRETDPFEEQILAGLKPYKIHIDVVNGELQLPATVSLTWPPAEVEGIQIGTPEEQQFFVWAKSEKEALLNLARINKSKSATKATVEAI
jgi:hypothetical protein